MIKELVLDLEAIACEIEDNLNELKQNLVDIRETTAALKQELKDEELLDDNS